MKQRPLRKINVELDGSFKARKGFFPQKQISLIKEFAQIEQDKSCEICGLYKGCNSPKMNYTGGGEKGVLIIAEAPGKKEDEKGVQLIGDAGQLFRKKLKLFDLDLDRDFWKLNAVNCRTPDNRKPTRREMKCCKPRIDKAIRELNPKFIWLMGGAAVESFYMDRFSGLGITRWRGRCIPDRDTGAWIVPMFHSSFLLRSGEDENLDSVFTRDLKRAVSYLSREPFSFEDETKQVRVLTSFEDVEKLLQEILSRKDLVTFDYETSGLKPYRPGHKIWTIGLTSDKLYPASFSFPYQYPHWSPQEFRRLKRLWRRVLRECSLVAQNLKFEDMWSRMIVGQILVNWVWDTMVSSHVLDDRSGVTGLKFQAYVRWGALAYDEAVKLFIKVKPGKDFNTLDSVPLDELCLYNGLDALFTYRLYLEQKEELQKKRGLLKAYELFHEGLLTFSDIQAAGVGINENHFEQEHKDLTIEIDTLEKELEESKESKLFRRKYDISLKLGSSDHLRKLFFTVLGLKPQKLTTSKKNVSVDHDVLVGIGSSFTRKLLRLRKLLKVRDTYLAQIRKEVVNGRIHPFFDLHTARSFRSSSSSPNLQNIPVRDEEARRAVRKGIIPSPGNKLIEWDYCLAEGTSVEVVGGCRNIEDIVEECDSEDIYVYCYDQKEKRIGMSKVIRGGLTGRNVIVWKAILDNGKEILATPDHQFMLRNGEYRKLRNLVAGDSLMPLYKKVEGTGNDSPNYVRVYLNNGTSILEHNLVALDIFGVTIAGSKLVVHHKDGNGINNRLSNLEVMDRSEYMSIHTKQSWVQPKKKRTFSWHKSKEYSRKLSESKKEYWRKWREKKRQDTLNHEIVSVQFYGYRDVYNIEVEDCHNFALEAGIIVKNSGIEVCIACCYTKDPVLVAYINDPASDMHRDLATELFGLTNNQVTKDLRFYAKNGFVFPEFYGSYYEACAASLWETCAGLETTDGVKIREHLRSVGITGKRRNSYSEFESHVKDVETAFWEKFGVFKEWQEAMIDFYHRRGYVELFHGHRRGGFLRKNEIINTPFQGTAFHCLLWSLNRLNALRKFEQWRTKIVGQIHDSGLYDQFPSEQQHVVDTTHRVACKEIREYHDWLIVPLSISFEVTPIDGSWYDKEDLQYEPTVAS